MKYFSYGSNLSSKRMSERNVDVLDKKSGILEGYKFTINKKSYKDPTLGFANIIKDDNSFVEGIIYDISDESISILDSYEGYPKHYYKEILPIKVNNEYIDCVIYIANEKWISKNELLTTLEYKNYILDGKDFLTDEYYNMLNEKIKIKNI